MTSQGAQLTPLGNALAGALGAVFANSAVYPLDTVKTVIQATKADRKGKGKQSSADRLSAISLLLRIFKEEGLWGFYSGYAATMLNTFSNQYAYFFFYSAVRSSYIRRLAKKLPPGSPIPALSTAAELILGAVAGALSQIFTIPVSVIAVRQQIHHNASVSESKSYAEAVKEPAGKETGQETGQSHHAHHHHQPKSNSFMEVAKQIIKEDGVAGLWLGLKPSLVLTVNPAITYGVFERIKGVVLLGKPQNTKLSPGTAFLLGALSKTLATVVTYPYIMAKVRIQAGTEEGSSGSDSSDSEGEGEEIPPPITMQTKHILQKASVAKTKAYHRDVGALDILKRVYLEQGVVGWYQGMQAQILKAVLSQALLFVMKDRFEILAFALMRFFARLRGKVHVK